MDCETTMDCKTGTMDCKTGTMDCKTGTMDCKTGTMDWPSPDTMGSETGSEADSETDSETSTMDWPSPDTMDCAPCLDPTIYACAWCFMGTCITHPREARPPVRVCMHRLCASPDDSKCHGGWPCAYWADGQLWVRICDQPVLLVLYAKHIEEYACFPDFYRPLAGKLAQRATPATPATPAGKSVKPKQSIRSKQSKRSVRSKQSKQSIRSKQSKRSDQSRSKPAQ